MAPDCRAGSYVFSEMTNSVLDESFAACSIAAADKAAQTLRLHAHAAAEPAALRVVELAESGTLQHRVMYVDRDGSAASPYHDLPLHAGHGLLNFVCLTPQGRWAEYEAAENEPFTPLRIRQRRGRPSHYSEDCLSWNFGFLPQTCGQLEPGREGGAEEGGGGRGQGKWRGPVEVAELGTRRVRTGEVYPVRPLGALCVVDGKGNHSWKILALAVQEEGIEYCTMLEDLLTGLSGTLHELQEWLKRCHVDIEAGDLENRMRDRQPVGPEMANHVVDEAHAIWRQCVDIRDLRATWKRQVGRAQSTADFEKLWENYTADASRVRISLSASDNTSLVHLDRAWADSAHEDVWEASWSSSSNGSLDWKKDEKEAMGKESSKSSGSRTSMKMAQIWKLVVNAIRPTHTETAQFRNATASPSSMETTVARMGSTGKVITRRRSLPPTGMEESDSPVPEGLKSGIRNAGYSLSSSFSSSSKNSGLASADAFPSPTHHRMLGKSSLTGSPKSGPLEATFDMSEREKGVNNVRRVARLRRASSLTASFLEASLRQVGSSPLHTSRGAALGPEPLSQPIFTLSNSAGELAQPSGLRSCVSAPAEGYQEPVLETRLLRAYRSHSHKSLQTHRAALHASIDFRDISSKPLPTSNSRDLQAALCEGASQQSKPKPGSADGQKSSSSKGGAESHLTSSPMEGTSVARRSHKRGGGKVVTAEKSPRSLSAKVTLTKGLAERLREQSQGSPEAVSLPTLPL